MGEAAIRPGCTEDRPDLTALYNHYVVSSTVTFDIEPFEVEQRRAWFDHYETVGRHRLFVSDSAGRVVGYATSSEFRGKPAYDPSVETTVYVAPDFTGRGIGGRRADGGPATIPAGKRQMAEGNVVTEDRLRRMRVLAAAPIGTRERVLLLEVHGQQLLIGVTAQHVTNLHTFSADAPPVSADDDFKVTLKSWMGRA